MMMVGLMACSAWAAEPRPSKTADAKTPVSVTTAKNRAKVYGDNGGVNAGGRKYVYVSAKDVRGIKDPAQLQAVLSPTVTAGDNIRKVAMAVDLRGTTLNVVVPKGGSFNVGVVELEDSRKAQRVEVSTVVQNVNLHVVGR